MSPRQARIGVDVFTILVVGSVGVALAGLTWRLLGDPGTRFGASPVAVRPVLPVDITPLIALAPFGAAPAANASAQATDQPLTLRGILLAQPRSASSALIAIGASAPVAFYIGQTVGASTIDSIEIDHVVLLSGGIRTILAFPNAKVAAESGASGAAPTTTGAAGDMIVSPPPPPVSPSAVSPPPAAAPSGPPDLLRSLDATVSAKGLSVGNPNQTMVMAGLQPGDQISTINGTPANEVARNPALLKPILAAGTAQIEVVRGGQKVTLSVPVR
jgi:general secretion pathway protein C